MNPQPIPHIWSSDALYAKAQRFAEEMIHHGQSDWQFGFWSALTLELLVRSSLASISPVLVADGKEWANLLFAVGREPNQKKFSPKSADVSVLLVQMENTFSDFTNEMANFCASHFAKRNSDVHSGDLPFDNVGTSKWLPMFYLTCECVLKVLDKSLADCFGSEHEKGALEQIQALRDEAAKAVAKSINAHKVTWSELEQVERNRRRLQAEASVTRYLGHRVSCPACESIALLHGSPTGAVQRSIEDDVIIEKQSMLPSLFECAACQLKISGYSRLVACGLGDAFTSTSIFNPIEYFGIDIANEYENMMGDDNNEPY